MTTRRFQQVDVFSVEPFRGNPVAVVIDGDGLTPEAMAAFARWTNLSETTFVLAPEDPEADYRLRIFTPGGELPFAGHPTLGSAHAWLRAGGVPRQDGVLVQECGLGLVRLRVSDGLVCFAAPPRLRTGPVEEELLTRAAAALGIDRTAILRHEWADNGPGWIALELASAEDVLALRPDAARFDDLAIGVVGRHEGVPDGSAEPLIEVRAFIPSAGVLEDPVTGSLNAAVAQWLLGEESVPDRYIAAQGTVLDRAGRIAVERLGDDVWIGGATTTLIEGVVEL